MTREVTREVTEHANLIGQLQGELKSVTKAMDGINGTQKEIFEKIDKTEKYLAKKIEESHCKKEELFADHEERIVKVEEEIAPIKNAKAGAIFSAKTIGILWHSVTALIIFYIALMTYLNSIKTP